MIHSCVVQNAATTSHRGAAGTRRHTSTMAMPWAAVYQPTITTVATYPSADSGVKCQSAATSQ